MAPQVTRPRLFCHLSDAFLSKRNHSPAFQKACIAFLRGNNIRPSSGKRNKSSVVAQVVLAPRLSLLQISEEPECGMVESFQIKQYQCHPPALRYQLSLSNVITFGFTILLSRTFHPFSHRILLISFAPLTQRQTNVFHTVTWYLKHAFNLVVANLISSNRYVLRNLSNPIPSHVIPSYTLVQISTTDGSADPPEPSNYNCSNLHRSRSCHHRATQNDFIPRLMTDSC